MRASDLILYILQHRPLPTTKLVKLLYLVDLAWVQLTGKPLTNLPYSWHLRGPYCDEIETALWDLEDERAVTVTSGTTQDGYDYTLYTAATALADHVDPDVEKVVRYIVRRFSDMKLQSLLGYVYATPPMAQVQTRGERFVKLDLKLDSKRRFSRDDVRSILDQQLAADTAKRVPGDEVMNKLGIN